MGWNHLKLEEIHATVIITILDKSYDAGSVVGLQEKDRARKKWRRKD